MRRHVTHHSDCGCLTARYKIAINALTALRAHMAVSDTRYSGLFVIDNILSKAFESLKKLDAEIEVAGRT